MKKEVLSSNPVGNIEKKVNEPEPEEKEIARDVGAPRREKINIPPDMTQTEIREKYGVSKATASRAKGRGWIFMGYHKRLIDTDEAWGKEHVQEIKKSAEVGARMALSLCELDFKSIRPFDFEDVVSAAYVRLIELSGHPNRGVSSWRNAVAKNGALNFINDQIMSVGKVFRSVRPGIRSEEEKIGGAEE